MKIYKLINGIISYFTIVTIGLGVCILIIGWLLEGILQDIVISIGSTTFSIGLISIAYQQWQDKKLDTRLENIEKHLKIGCENILKCLPGMPYDIIPSTSKPDKEDPITTTLIHPECNVKEYYYIGIGMSVMAKAIKRLVKKKQGALKAAIFIIPDPSIVSNDYRVKMKQSIETIINVWDSVRNGLNLEFVLLNNLPLFHIHKTGTDCWFAFVDQEEKEQYPVTYHYKKKAKYIDELKVDEPLMMYTAINEMIKDLHKKNDSDKIYKFEAPRASHGKRICKGSQEITKEEFITLFN